MFYINYGKEETVKNLVIKTQMDQLEEFSSKVMDIQNTVGNETHNATQEQMQEAIDSCAEGLTLTKYNTYNYRYNEVDHEVLVSSKTQAELDKIIRLEKEAVLDHLNHYLGDDYDYDNLMGDTVNGFVAEHGIIYDGNWDEHFIFNNGDVSWEIRQFSYDQEPDVKGFHEYSLTHTDDELIAFIQAARE